MKNPFELDIEDKLHYTNNELIEIQILFRDNTRVPLQTPDDLFQHSYYNYNCANHLRKIK